MKFFGQKLQNTLLPKKKKENTVSWQNLKHNQFCKRSVTTNTNGYNMFVIWTDPESHRLL